MKFSTVQYPIFFVKILDMKYRTDTENNVLALIKNAISVNMFIQ